MSSIRLRMRIHYRIGEIIPISEAGSIQERFPGGPVIGVTESLLTYDFRHHPPLLFLQVQLGKGGRDA